MANMGYCRFQNTLSDLYDCESALHETPFEELSEDEQRACRKMYKACKMFIETYEDDMTTPEYGS